MTQAQSDPPDLRGPFLGRLLRGQKRRKPYKPHKDLVTAANVALHLEMPLLLTGEPGCGKTDFAWAAATALAAAQKEAAPDEAQPLECYVRSESRARDLLYSYDALGRFGDAHHGDAARARDITNYLKLEPLGEALLSQRRRVVLVDEIDKAPRDLPNDLLRELDQGHFDIAEVPLSADPKGPGLQRRMRRPDALPMPLVIITSNAERQLPDPFLRRCVFFHIPFPTPGEMREIISSFFAAGPGGPGEPVPDPDLISRALDLFYELRERGGLVKKPATVELLGWLRALALLHRRDRGALEGLSPVRNALQAGNMTGPWWQGVPALGCLVKLREDRDTLFGAAAR